MSGTDLNMKKRNSFVQPARDIIQESQLNEEDSDHEPANGDKHINEGEVKGEIEGDLGGD